jgi:hypothetical protein
VFLPISTDGLVDTCGMAGAGVDFFIGHAGSDQAWAEWAAWELGQARYAVELDVWDWATGRNFVLEMSDALDRADRVLALYSRAYFDRSRYTTQEWTSSVVNVTGLSSDRLVPIRVENVPIERIPAVLRPLAFRDVFGLPEEAARQVLLEAVRGPSRPDRKPSFPSSAAVPAAESSPGFPGALPRIWNVSPRNVAFTGRDAMLTGIRDRLRSEGQVSAQALVGMGGAGKTQVAVEYAHRFSSDYDLVWWIAAEQGALIGEQVAALASEMGCAAAGTPVPEARQAVFSALRTRTRWLLVFDNAQGAGDIADWLPGNGHVLITSRARDWAEIAVTLDVGMLERPESVALLRRRVPELSGNDGDQLAEELGDLPLALAQAGGYLASTGMSAANYLELLRSRAAELLGRGQPLSYPLSLAASTQLAFEQLAATDAAAAELATLAAFLAPEPISTSWLAAAEDWLPAALATVAGDALMLGDIRVRLGEQSLARVDERGVQFHRLTQAILRDQVPAGQVTAIRAQAAAVVVAGYPGDPNDPAMWPRWAQLMPHLLATNPASSEDLRLRATASDAAWYLIMRGDSQAGLDLARRLYRDPGGSSEDEEISFAAGNSITTALTRLGRFGEAREIGEEMLNRVRQRYSEHHPKTLPAAIILAVILRESGDIAGARDLDRITLAAARRALGDDDPRTLVAASNLAIELRRLGDAAAARDLDRDVLDRRVQVLGADHPETMTSAHNLAADLRELGQTQSARELDEDTLERRREILGDDHPYTLASAVNLALDLKDAGELASARDLGEDTLERCQRTLGRDHPSTMLAAQNLASVYRGLGEPHKALNLNQDALSRKRVTQGEDDPDTLTTAHGLAFELRDLGDMEAARDLDQDTHDRRSRVLGPDHPDTLWSASNLAADLHALGQPRAARDLNRDTLQRRLRTLGPDHPDTMTSAINLAHDKAAIADE